MKQESGLPELFDPVSLQGKVVEAPACGLYDRLPRKCPS